MIPGASSPRSILVSEAGAGSAGPSPAGDEVSADPEATGGSEERAGQHVKEQAPEQAPGSAGTRRAGGDTGRAGAGTGSHGGSVKGKGDGGGNGEGGDDSKVLEEKSRGEEASAGSVQVGRGPTARPVRAGGGCRLLGGEPASLRPVSFLQLPTEVCSAIFSKLTLSRDVAAAAMVCRQWRQLVPTSITRLLLSHRTRLAATDLVRALPAFPSLQELALPPVFQGQVYDALLNTIASSCPALTSLNASGFRSQSFAFSAPAISALLDSCPGIKHLKLGTRVCSDMAPAPALLLASAPLRPQLRSLSLERCSLPSPADIPLSHLLQLHELALVECSFPDRGSRSDAVGDITTLFSFLGGLTGLTRLHLSLLDMSLRARLLPNEAQGEELWLRKLGNLCALRALTLCGLWQTHSLPASWSRCLTALSSLRLLQMRDFVNFASLYQMTGLSELAISHCPVVDSIPPLLFGLSRLSALAFTHSPELRHIPQSISQLHHLSLLDLSGNTRLRTVPQAVCRLGRLETLCLSGCRGLTAVPVELGDMPSLRTLDLSYCNGSIQLPSSLQANGPRLREGRVRVLLPTDRPSAPSLWCPFDPVLQLHPAVRNYSSTAVEEDRLLFHFLNAGWVEWNEEGEGWESDDGLGDLGYGDLLVEDDMQEDWWDGYVLDAHEGGEGDEEHANIHTPVEGAAHALDDTLVGTDFVDVDDDALAADVDTYEFEGDVDELMEGDVYEMYDAVESGDQGDFSFQWDHIGP